MTYRVVMKPDVCFAMRGRRKLHLDIYRPVKGARTRPVGDDGQPVDAGSGQPSDAGGGTLGNAGSGTLGNAGSERRPAVLCIHGGAWYLGDKRDIDLQVEIARRLAMEGIVAVAPNYRLSLEAPFPAQLGDVRSALEWVRAHADELAVDSSRIGVIGVSAGAHLAALLAAHEPGLCAVVSACGPMDLTEAGIAGADHPEVVRVVELLVGGDRFAKAELLRLASPLYQVHGDMPPFFLLHGEGDPTVPVRQAYAMAEKLEAHGVPATLVVTRNGHHHPLKPVDETKPVVPGPDEVLAQVFGFLRERLKPAGM